MKSDPDKNYLDFKKRFEKMTDEELIATYKKDLPKPGWVAARGRFLTAIKEEFEKRGIDMQRIRDQYFHMN